MSKTKTSNHSLRRGSTVLAVLVLLTLALVTLPSRLSPASNQLRISFPTVDGLLAGSDVLENGVQVGIVTSITPETNDSAMVLITVDGGAWPLHRGLSAAIRPKSLLGEEYVALTDGSAGGPAYNTARVLVESSTAVPVELDQFIDSLDPQTRVAAETLLDDLGAGVAGQGQTINSAIGSAQADLNNLAATGKTLDGRDPELDQVIVSLNQLLQSETTDSQLTQINHLINSGDATLAAVESQRTAFERSFVDANTTLTELNASLQGNVAGLRGLLNEAPASLQSLTQETTMLDEIAGGVNQPEVRNALIAGIEHGPEASGGALEQRSDGSSSAIFRICLAVPVPGSCDSSASTEQQASVAVFSSWLGA